MDQKNTKPDTWVTFEHSIGGCGGHFQTRLSMLRDFPEKVLCPGCPSSLNDDKIDALRAFGNAATDLIAAKNVLEKAFSLKLLDHLW